jgi:hypothetical protein
VTNRVDVLVTTSRVDAINYYLANPVHASRFGLNQAGTVLSATVTAAAPYCL